MIQETISLRDDVSDAAKGAAFAVEQLAKASARAKKALGTAGASMRTVNAALRDEQKALGAVAKAEAAVQRSAKKLATVQVKESAAAAREQTAQGKQAARAMRAEHSSLAKLQRMRAQGEKAQSAAAAKRMLSEHKASAATAVSGPLMLGVLTGVAAGATLAAKKVIDLGVSFLRAVAGAHETRTAAKGMLDALTAGRGEKVLTALDKMTLKLGVSLEDGRAQFAAYAKATGSIKTSAALVKLRAELRASGQDATMADAEIQKVLDAPAGKTIQAMTDVAKAAGVVGDGALAAKKKMETWNGAMGRIKDAGARIFDGLAKSAGPTLDKIGKSVNKMLNDFQKSKEGQAAMAAIESAMLGVLSAVETLVPLVMPFITGLAAGLKPVLAALAPIGKAIMSAFGGSNADAMKTAERVGKALGVTLTILGALAVAALTPIVAPLAAIGVVAGVVASGVGKLIAAGANLAGALPSLIGQAVNRAKALLDLLVGTATSAAANLISGLVSGITGGVGKVVAAVRGLGASVKSALFGALGIKSPSKIGIEAMMQVGAGMAKGAPQAALVAASATENVGASAASGLSGGVSATNGGASGGVSLTVNVAVGGGAAGGAQSPQALGAEIASAVRREIEVLSRRHAFEGGR